MPLELYMYKSLTESGKPSHTEWATTVWSIKKGYLTQHLQRVHISFSTAISKLTGDIAF